MPFSIVYYTNNVLSEAIFNTCLGNLLGIQRQTGCQLVAVSWEPIAIAENIIFKSNVSSHHSIYNQILKGLEFCKHQQVFLAEHDVLYPKSHFDLKVGNKLVYNSNIWYLTQEGYLETPSCNFLSTLTATKKQLELTVEEKLNELNRIGYVTWAEPDLPVGWEKVHGADPILDIRHTSNFTGPRKGEEKHKINKVNIIERQVTSFWGPVDRFDNLWK